MVAMRVSWSADLDDACSVAPNALVESAGPIRDAIVDMEIQARLCAANDD